VLRLEPHLDRPTLLHIEACSYLPPVATAVLDRGSAQVEPQPHPLLSEGDSPLFPPLHASKLSANDASCRRASTLLNGFLTVKSDQFCHLIFQRETPAVSSCDAEKLDLAKGRMLLILFSPTMFLGQASVLRDPLFYCRRSCSGTVSLSCQICHASSALLR